MSAVIGKTTLPLTCALKGIQAQRPGFSSEPEKLLHVSTKPEDSRVSLQRQYNLGTPYTGQSRCRKALHYVLYGLTFVELWHSDRTLHPLDLPGFADFI